MSKEIINLHFGQAGSQMGSAIWELLCHEHRINHDGHLTSENRDPLDKSQDTFFRISLEKNNLTPRAIFVDLEPNVIDEIKSGCYRGLFDSTDLLNAFDGASSNFARGFYYNQSNIRESVEDRIRLNLEMCESCQAVMIYRSLGGGTGTGFSNAMLEYLSMSKGKLTKMDFPVYPSSRLTTSVLEPYNCILDFHFSMEDIDLSFMFDNEALYKICLDLIEIKKPNYNNLNRVMAQVVSSITASTRYCSILTNGITVMSTNLIPFPRIHYPLLTYSPMENHKKAEFDQSSVLEITENLFLPESQMVTCDPMAGKYFSCSCIYRGNISIPEIYRALEKIKSKDYIQFVDWCPTGFKVGVTNAPSVQVKGSGIGSSPKQVIMIANTSSISEILQRVLKKFYFLFSKRSFIHWYVGEGIEEGEFMDAFYNIGSLIIDYREVCKEFPIAKTYLPSVQENPFTNQGNTNNEDKVKREMDPDNQSCDDYFYEVEEDIFNSNANESYSHTSDDEINSFDIITPISSQISDEESTTCHSDVEISKSEWTIYLQGDI